MIKPPISVQLQTCFELTLGKGEGISSNWVSANLLLVLGTGGLHQEIGNHTPLFVFDLAFQLTFHTSYSAS